LTGSVIGLKYSVNAIGAGYLILGLIGAFLYLNLKK
jgi:hypothetical protein